MLRQLSADPVSPRSLPTTQKLLLMNTGNGPEICAEERGMNLTAFRWQAAATFPRARHRRETVNPEPLEELRDTSSPSRRDQECKC